MRKLASVQKIEKVEEIPGADKIEKITVLGWELVSKKGEFKSGDKCVYFEVDSILPKDNPVFEFMAPRKYRVKTIRLRKQVSMGLALRLNLLDIPEDTPIDTDVTERLGVKKYDPQASKEKILEQEQSKKANPFHKLMLRFYWYRKIFSKKKKSWPYWIQKTDEIRLQSVPFLLSKLDNVSVYKSEKLDGQSSSYSLKKIKHFPFINTLLFTVCSRNVWLKTPINNNYWKIARKYEIEKALRDHYKRTKKELLIQGEIIGESIQGNKYKLDDLDFYVFNVYNITDDTWYGVQGIIGICAILGLKHVPLLSKDTRVMSTVNEMIEDSKGYSKINPKTVREGVVWRTAMAEHGKRQISFKCINPDFLLNEKD